MLTDYIECALWASTDDDDGEPLDGLYSADDLAPETRATMQAELTDFAQLVEREGVDRSAWTDAQLAHDFWLTRNHHGAGFWGRGHGAPGDQLTALAHSYGEANLYIGDDGLIYQM